MIRLPARQVHLDFHTSGLIPDVGARFDERRFQQALRLGAVQSVTVFAKCHHSWSYYPTKVGMPHPGLRTDLLGRAIAACHGAGVRAPVYYTIGFSETEADRHPEWVARNRDGSAANCFWDPHAKPSDPRPGFCWRFLCPSGAYRRQILAQVSEIVETYPVDGFFFDICFITVCHCAECRAAMKARGLDPARDEDARTYDRIKWQGLCADLNGLIHARHPDATVFYNGGASPYTPEWHVGDSHIEIEDLPSSDGSYDRFPLRARYFAGTGKQFVAMSGKFHTGWGEFGGYKHPEAIRYEAAAMIAYGARCTFGDQLHPSGEVDLETYRNIGHAYRYVRRIERLGLDADPVANLGLWLSGSNPDDQGTASMLLELHRDFRVVGPGSALDGLEAVVVAGGPCLDEASAGTLAAYASGGGRLLLLGEAALDADRRRFLLDTGCRYLGPSSVDIDYIAAHGALGRGIVKAPFLAYTPAFRAEPDGATVLATLREPYFSRTYAQFCSHQNTPYRLHDAVLPSGAPVPAAWRAGRIVSVAHPLGGIYFRLGARIHRDYFANALALVHRHPVVAADLPSAGRVTLVRQPRRNRYVAHLLYAPGLTRGRTVVLEDMPELRDVRLVVRVPEHIRAATLEPGGRALRLGREKDGTASVIVPSVACHQAVAFRY
jgi:hypothetical protein